MAFPGRFQRKVSTEDRILFIMLRPSSLCAWLYKTPGAASSGGACSPGFSTHIEGLGAHTKIRVTRWSPHSCLFIKDNLAWRRVVFNILLG